MPQYNVVKKEIHLVYVAIEAESPEEAYLAVAVRNEGTEVLVEYSHTWDPDTWEVSDTKGDIVYSRK